MDSNFLLITTISLVSGINELKYSCFSFSLIEMSSSILVYISAVVKMVLFVYILIRCCVNTICRINLNDTMLGLLIYLLPFMN